MDEKYRVIIDILSRRVGKEMNHAEQSFIDQELKGQGILHEMQIHLPYEIGILKEEQFATGFISVGTYKIITEFEGAVGGARKGNLGWMVLRLISIQYVDGGGKRQVIDE